MDNEEIGNSKFVQKLVSLQKAKIDANLDYFEANNPSGSSAVRKTGIALAIAIGIAVGILIIHYVTSAIEDFDTSKIIILVALVAVAVVFCYQCLKPSR